MGGQKKPHVGKNVPQNIHKFIFCGKHIENQKKIKNVATKIYLKILLLRDEFSPTLSFAGKKPVTCG